MQDLGTLGGTNSWASGVSANGAVVVGDSLIAGGAFRAFRWTGSGMQDLGTLGGTNSSASGVSADGAVVVGGSQIAGDATSHAFRWTGGGMQDLGTLGGAESWASGVSADGAVVVGNSQTTGGPFHAFRWTGGGMQDLGTLGGAESWAKGISADGAVVVGGSETAGGTFRAFRWTDSGMQDVADWLSAAGVTMPAGWTLREAAATNADGSVVVGIGSNASGNDEAWLARVSPLGSGLISPAAFNASVREAGARAVQAGTMLPGLALFGAHHRSLLDAGLARKAGGACAWATADGMRNHSADTRIELAEAGVCKDVGSARFGAGVGKAWARQDWSLGGGAEYDGQYLVAEAANAFGNGMEASLTGYYGRFDTQLRRNYRNGAAVDRSHGRPDAKSAALRARLDWKDAAQAGPFSLSPYAAYTRMETRLDAYTETGGGFPVAYGASKWKTDDLRAGLAARMALSAATDLRLAGEIVHRFDDDTGGVNGQVLGLWRFSLPGQKTKQNWARAMADVDHRFRDGSVLTVGANLGSPGGDASWGVTVGYRASF
jgi:probable HAF family extracellular repeat protein